jgi:hypothetical protein
MPNVYIQDQTKQILEKVSDADQRTQDGEINYLLRKRLQELNIPDDTKPSVCNSTNSKPDSESQEKC